MATPAPHQQLELLLRNHDWGYDYSDDGSTYRRGLAEEKAIEQLLRDVPPAVAKGLWERYAPKGRRYTGPDIPVAPPLESFTIAPPYVEDEASINAYEFAPKGGVVQVTPRYYGYPELEVPEVMKAEEARKMWHSLHREGWRRRASSERVASAHLTGGPLPTPWAR